jgi:hypothetical protein
VEADFLEEEMEFLRGDTIEQSTVGVALGVRIGGGSDERGGDEEPSARLENAPEIEGGVEQEFVGQVHEDGPAEDSVVRLMLIQGLSVWDALR